MEAGSREVGNPAQRGATGDWRRTSPVAVVFFAFRFVRRLLTDGMPALAPAVAAVAASDRLSWSWLVALAVVAGAGAVVWGVLSWARFRFCLGGGQVQVRRGVLSREHLTIDFDRVQNVSIREPLYMRPFGLVSLTIDTAGSHGKEVALGGIDRALAMDLRREMLAAPGPPDAAATFGGVAADAGPAPESPVLLRRTTRDLVVHGLTAASLVWIAVLVGFVFSSAESLPIDWNEWLQDALRSDGDATPVPGPLLAAAAGLAVLLLVPILSVAGAIVRHHGYALSFDGQTFRRTSGLLSRHDSSLRQQKIQAVEWRQNVLARAFGRVNVKLDVTRAGEAESAAGARSTPAFLVPALRPAEARALTTRFLPGSSAREPAFSPIRRRPYLLRGLLLGWLPILLVSASGPAIAVHWLFALAVPLGLIVGGLILRQLARRYGYAVDVDHGYLRRGFLGHRVTVFPLRKVQRVDVRQTPSQRRAGLAHLTIHLASGSTTIAFLPLADAETLRDLAVFHAESDLRPWY